MENFPIGGLSPGRMSPAEFMKVEMLPYVVGGGVVAATAVYLAVRTRRKTVMTTPKDTVVLHQIGRGPWAPSLSPFPLKLETFLRMAKIPYENSHAYKMSKKGKTPFITYNGEEISDSQFCIDWLNNKYNKDMNSALTEEQKAVGRAFQKMFEENTYWTLVLQRWVYDPDGAKKILEPNIPGIPGLTWLLSTRVRSKVKDQCHAQGMGRHESEEVLKICDSDFNALSTYLGDKPFLMGQEPCEFDCALFGLLAQCKWNLEGSPHEGFVKNKYPNLSAYCDRMKDRFWPDWEECITKGCTTKAVK